ncbi:hypothetical protein QTP88_008751 [Uroleucon formosanum]
MVYNITTAMKFLKYHSYLPDHYCTSLVSKPDQKVRQLEKFVNESSCSVSCGSTRLAVFGSLHTIGPVTMPCSRLVTIPLLWTAPETPSDPIKTASENDFANKRHLLAVC